MRTMRIRELRAEDWPAVEAIYAEGIATRNATFETETPTWAEFDAGRLRDHRLVAIDGDRIVGWAAFSPTSSRACYAGVVEHSVYVASEYRGRGIGRTLLEALVHSADIGRDLDDPDERVPRERGEPRAPRTRRVPGSRTP